MRSMLAILRLEWRLQLRSLRFRFGVASVLVLACLGPLQRHLTRELSSQFTGFESYVGRSLTLGPLFATVLAVLVVGATARVDGQLLLLAPARMSAAGFLLRKWAAQLLVVLGTCALAVLLAGALSVFLAGAPPRLELPLWTFLLRVLPAAALVTAYWLGAVTIWKSELIALFATLLGGGLLLHAVNELLFLFDVGLADTLGELVGLAALRTWHDETWMLLAQKSPVAGYWPAATASRYAPGAALDWLLPRFSLLAGVAVATLAASVAWVGRTRPDLEPWRVRPDHPLRTLLGFVATVRQRNAPEWGLERGDRLLAVLGLVAIVLGAVYPIVRSRIFYAEATALYEMESGDPLPPTPLTLRPLRWRIRGTLDRHGGIRTELLGSLRNVGSEPEDWIAFALDSHLALDRLTAEGHTLTVERHASRLGVRLQPAVAPGQELVLAAEVSGRPEHVAFWLYWPRSGSFSIAYQSLEAREASELPPLALSHRDPLLSARRVVLAAQHLTLVPRYTEWTLTPPPPAVGLPGLQVPEESLMPEVDVELDLATPPSWVVADSCGSSNAATGVLHSRCRRRLHELEVVGGALEAASTPSGNEVFAVLPEHAHLAGDVLASISTVLATTDRAWPGTAPLERLAAVEIPPRFAVDPFEGMGSLYREPPAAELRGRLLRVPEATLVAGEPLPIPQLVAGALAEQLFEGRALDVREEAVLLQIVQTLMLRRMGLEEQASAVLTFPPWLLAGLRRPILAATPEHPLTFSHRLPAVLHDLQHRVGQQALYDGIEAFRSSSDRPGTVRELLAEVEAASGVSLQRLYDDHFVGRALPQLELGEVAVRRRGAGFVVLGSVRNAGTGEAVCPLVAKGDVHEATVEVTVEEGEPVRFEIPLVERPHTLLIDPDGRCLRLKPPGAQDRRDLRSQLALALPGSARTMAGGA